MTASKDKGTAYETAVVKFMRANGFGQAERRALRGKHDVGDILVCPGVIAECKSWASYGPGQVTEWLEETWRETNAANASVGLLIIKRPRLNVSLSRCFYRGEWGFWYEQPLAEGLERLRLCGWGDLA